MSSILTSSGRTNYREQDVCNSLKEKKLKINRSISPIHFILDLMLDFQWRRSPGLRVKLLGANFIPRLVIGQSLDPTIWYLCNANSVKYII